MTPQPRTALRRVAAYFGDGPLVVEDGIITRPEAEAAAPLRAALERRFTEEIQALNEATGTQRNRRGEAVLAGRILGVEWALAEARAALAQPEREAE